MFKIKKIKTFKDAEFFTYDFLICSGHKIPANYFLSGETYCFFNLSGIIGGYSLIHHESKRTLLQIPADDPSIKCIYDLNRRSTEITGYFILKGMPGFILTCHFFLRVFLSPHKFFIYSYDRDNKKLEKHYSYGKPFRLYSGIVKNLEGMAGLNYENVEVITRLGFIRLWINRITRKVFKWK